MSESIPKSGFHFSKAPKIKEKLLFADLIAIPFIASLIVSYLEFNIWLSLYTILKLFLFYNGLLFFASSARDQHPIEQFWDQPAIPKLILSRRFRFIWANMAIMFFVQVGMLFLMRYSSFPEITRIPRSDAISTDLLFLIIFVLGHLLTLSAIWLELYLFVRWFYLRQNTGNGNGLFVVDISKIGIFIIVGTFSLGSLSYFSAKYQRTSNPLFIYIDVAVLLIINFVAWFFGYRKLRQDKFIIPEYDPKSKVKIDIKKEKPIL